MLTKIVKNLDISTLFNCRLVNRTWSGISTQILTTRPETELSFSKLNAKKKIMQRRFEDSAGEKDKSGKKKVFSLENFTKCMEKFKENPCPFARFSFTVTSTSFFDDKAWIQFSSHFGSTNPNENPDPDQNTKIKYLGLEFYNMKKIDSLPLLTEKVRDLLLNKFPRLEEFDLKISSAFESMETKLFPESESESESESNKTKKTAVQLPHLKVLHIQRGVFLNFPGIARDLLKAAVNLKAFHTRSTTAQTIRLLHSTGKIHLLRRVTVTADLTFVSAIHPANHNEYNNTNFPPLVLPTLNIEFLELETDTNARVFGPPFAHFLTNLFESCKDTLKTLKTEPFGFSSTGPQLRLPIFKNLRKLNLFSASFGEYGILLQIFPRGVRSSDNPIFPAVDSLKIRVEDWPSAFPHKDSIPILPKVENLTVLEIGIRGFNQAAILTLSLMCPNLKNLKITNDVENMNMNMEVPGLDFVPVARAIWTHMKQLESLEVDVDTNMSSSHQHNYKFPTLDSLFTGISVENCKELQRQRLQLDSTATDFMEAENRNGDGGGETKSPAKPNADLMIMDKEYPSILDMKDLRKLVINPYSGKSRHGGRNFFTKKITWISHEYAFNLMPHLEFNGRKQIDL